MSYAMLEEQIRALPEEYLEEISHYVEYILFRRDQSHHTKKRKI